MNENSCTALSQNLSQPNSASTRVGSDTIMDRKHISCLSLGKCFPLASKFSRGKRLWIYLALEALFKTMKMWWGKHLIACGKLYVFYHIGKILELKRIKTKKKSYFKYLILLCVTPFINLPICTNWTEYCAVYHCTMCYKAACFSISVHVWLSGFCPTKCAGGHFHWPVSQFSVRPGCN